MIRSFQKKIKISFVHSIASDSDFYFEVANYTVLSTVLFMFRIIFKLLFEFEFFNFEQILVSFQFLRIFSFNFVSSFPQLFVFFV